MSLILFDDCPEALLPLTFTRPVAALRVGILTIAEKWERRFAVQSSFFTSDYLREKFSCVFEEDNILIAGSLLPDENLFTAIKSLGVMECLMKDGNILAVRLTGDAGRHFLLERSEEKGFSRIDYSGEVQRISRLYDVFRLNASEIEKDFALVTKGRQSQLLSETVTVVGANKSDSVLSRVFIEEGAELECAILNPKDGPIYIGKNAKVLEGSLIRGAFALCEGAQVNMGAKIYSGTTIGPYSKVGGEISNSVILGYSNKGHDGYLGDSVIGEWCNLGADTNTSNLKNDYSKVKLWNYEAKRFLKTDLQFCGLIMGDFSRSAINTMFNTGTVVGVGSNVYGAGFPRNFIPSFLIGGSQGFKLFGVNSVIRTARIAQERRSVVLTEVDEKMIQSVCDMTEEFRKYLV